MVSTSRASSSAWGSPAKAAAILGSAGATGVPAMMVSMDSISTLILSSQGRFTAFLGGGGRKDGGAAIVGDGGPWLSYPKGLSKRTIHKSYPQELSTRAIHESYPREPSTGAMQQRRPTALAKALAISAPASAAPGGR